MIKGYDPIKYENLNTRCGVTVSGYQPKGGKKRFNVKVIVNEITEFHPKQATQQYTPQQNAQQNRPAPQQNRPAPHQHAPQDGFQNGQGFGQ